MSIKSPPTWRKVLHQVVHHGQPSKSHSNAHFEFTLVPIRAVVDPASDRGGAFFAHLVTATRLGPQKVHSYHSETSYCFYFSSTSSLRRGVHQVHHVLNASLNQSTTALSSRLQSVQTVYTRSFDQITASFTGQPATKGVHLAPVSSSVALTELPGYQHFR